MDRDYDYLYKILFLGSSGVGKSAILSTYFGEPFSHSYNTTIGLDFRMTYIDLKVDSEPIKSQKPIKSSQRQGSQGQNIQRQGSQRQRKNRVEVIKLQIWDTAGQERFQSIVESYYRGAYGAILVYDVTCRESFLQLNTWINSMKGKTYEDIQFLIVGNKIDLIEEEGNRMIMREVKGEITRKIKREVEKEEAAEFASKHNAGYIEVSAKTGENVKEMFSLITRSIYHSPLGQDAIPIFSSRHENGENGNEDDFFKKLHSERSQNMCCIIL